MTRARSCVLVAAVVLMAASPTAAYAASDVFGFLGELSGPGPWTINFAGVESRLWCQATAAALATDTKKQRVGNCLLDKPEKTRAVLSYQLTWAGTGVTKLFKDDPSDQREAREFTLSVAYMYRVSSFFEVGAGASYIHFYTGDPPSPSVNPNPNPDFGFSRLGLIPARVTLTPFAFSRGASPWARVVHLQFETTWIPGGFSGADFNNHKTAYDVNSDFQSRAVVLLDGAAVLRGITGW
jgi:hypothetical protein